MRLFLDANVLFTAAWQEGRARSLFLLAQRAGVHLLTSSHALEEARRNLFLKRPETLKVLEELSLRVERVPEAPIRLVRQALKEGLPPKDAPILEAAWAAKADLLVTGDRKHFGSLMGRKIRGVWVLSLKEAWSLLLENVEQQSSPSP
ncbi:MAG: PIN domain-containing protein [Thermus sp.]|uniref:PIN domain-containing protein n=1 Tax=Thermus brevis TaxID=2862456 RepID=A0ABS6ZXA0_9DEIN|nr:PIN domain-containing protein [Thermus brevis]MBW6394082.1 PIN domain-containing protein [Thermus brevis]